MKKILITSFIFLFVLTGCTSVRSLETDMQDLLEEISSNYKEGYTIEYSDSNNVNLIVVVDEESVDITYDKDVKSYKYTDDASGITLCSDDLCNDELTAEDKELYDKLIALPDDKIENYVNRYLVIMLKSDTKATSGEKKTYGTKSEGEYDYVQYGGLGDMILSTTIGITKDKDKISKDVETGDGVIRTYTYYLS